MFVRVALQMNGATADGTEFNAESLVSYEINRTDWHYQEGWYYYTKPLNPHETTSELMTQVIFKDISNITQTYPGGRFFLQIDAQAVQSENNADNALNASGWPRS